MLAELSFSPSIFLKSSYAVEELCDARLIAIRKGLLEHSISHDLRDGSLSRHALSHEDLHPKGKELLKKMQKSRRLQAVPAIGKQEPQDTLGWVQEAVASAGQLPVSGIIACQVGKGQTEDQPLVTDIARCPTSTWWTEGVMRNSWMLGRNAADYSRHIEPLMRHANSLAFFDPYLDPSENRYAYLPTIFEPVRYRSEKPTVEFHRIVFKGSGQNRQILDQRTLEAAFAPLSQSLKRLGVTATVYVWPNDHNRYLITDLGCFQFGNSLDTSEDTSTHDTWSRIERGDADKIARLHDPAVNGSMMRFRFEIGA
jgi:hypothetical protein